jgi:phenylpropionate dioxygenase-like ring-hydroxylating dioxygenase large terminal subunit
MVIPTSQRISLPPFPRGWFALAYSADLKPGDVTSRHYFGRELVLYRSEAGEAKVADAYCPHLGAHLGHGGRVEGERLVCPFHGWQFGADGRCTAMPYGTRIPDRARLQTWEVLEQDGVVLVYWDGVDGSGGGATWKPPAVDLASFSEMRTHDWELASHPQEVMENSADGAHFRFIHKTHYMAVAEGPELDDARFDIVFETDPTGVVAADRAPEGAPDLRYHVIVYGAGMVYGFMRPAGLDVTTVSRVYVTPIDGERVAMRVASNVAATADAAATTALADATAGATFDQVADDVVIWGHKLYRDQPALNEEESAVATFRRWYAQYYEPESTA